MKVIKLGRCPRQDILSQDRQSARKKSVVSHASRHSRHSRVSRQALKILKDLKEAERKLRSCFDGVRQVHPGFAEDSAHGD